MSSTQAESINNAIVGAVLTMRATVWERTGTTGPFNNKTKEGLACFLAEVNRNSASTGAGRRELAAVGTFQYDAAYTLPATCQIEVDIYPGDRWNPTTATRWSDYAPGIGVIGKSVDVTKV